MVAFQRQWSILFNLFNAAGSAVNAKMIWCEICTNLFLSLCFPIITNLRFFVWKHERTPIQCVHMQLIWEQMVERLLQTLCTHGFVAKCSFSINVIEHKNKWPHFHWKHICREYLSTNMLTNLIHLSRFSALNRFNVCTWVYQYCRMGPSEIRYLRFRIQSPSKCPLTIFSLTREKLQDTRNGQIFDKTYLLW